MSAAEPTPEQIITAARDHGQAVAYITDHARDARIMFLRCAGHAALVEGVTAAARVNAATLRFPSGGRVDFHTATDNALRGREYDAIHGTASQQIRDLLVPRTRKATQ